MFPGKRRYCDEAIDLPFLLNAKKMLTEKEFGCKMPNYPYADYASGFLKRKLTDTFEGNFQQQWFRDRYFREGIADSPTPFTSTRFVVLKDLSADAPVEALASKFECISGVTKVYVSQNDCTRGFTRDLYLNLSQSTEFGSIGKCIEHTCDPILFDLGTAAIAENYLASREQLAKVYQTFCQLSSLDESNMFNNFFLQRGKASERTVQSYTEILREVFNFCSTCCRQYDNKCAMAFHCSMHTAQDFCSRVLDLFGCAKDLKCMSTGSDGTELAELAVKTPGNSFRCRKCSETFSSTESINAHLSSKHGEALADGEPSRLSQFLSRVDFFILDMAQGTVDRTVPPYATVDESTVVYDLPKVFSGDIVLN